MAHDEERTAAGEGGRGPGREDDPGIPGSRAGDQVGLGRVVRDRLATGSPDPDDPGAAPDEPAVEEASAESFPASDPPSFTRERPARDPGT